jgi:hypothetical protein
MLRTDGNVASPWTRKATPLREWIAVEIHGAREASHMSGQQVQWRDLTKGDAQDQQLLAHQVSQTRQRIMDAFVHMLDSGGIDPSEL